MLFKWTEGDRQTVSDRKTNILDSVICIDGQTLSDRQCQSMLQSVRQTVSNRIVFTYCSVRQTLSERETEKQCQAERKTYKSQFVLCFQFI